MAQKTNINIGYSTKTSIIRATIPYDCCICTDISDSLKPDVLHHPFG